MGRLDSIEVNGPITQSQGGSYSLVSLPAGGAASFEDDYRISFFRADEARLVAIEYLVDPDDVASPIGYFEETFAVPDANGPGPEVTYAAATFDESEIEVTATDELFAERARPTNDPEHRRWYRAHLGAVVHDVDPFLGTWNVLGVTTEVERGGDSDVLHVAWNGAAVAGDVRTVVRVGDTELRVGAAATRAVSPADVADLDVPAPPRFAAAPFAEPVPLGPADLEIERPDWAVGPLVVLIEPRSGGEPLYGQDAPLWTVFIPEDATTFRLPAPPASRSTADVLGPAELRLVLVATNGVDPFAGVHWMAFDARPSAIAQ
jgi:hypothetical protein